jgi:hypothetical protein
MKVRQVLASALLLAICSVAALAQAPSSRRPSEDELWQRVEKANDAPMLEAFISAFPNSRHVPEARKRLAGLKPGSGTVGSPSGAQAHERPIGPDSGSTIFRTERFGEPRQGPQTPTSTRIDW